MNRKLICPVCGKEFVTDKNAAKYCSAKCRRKANAPQPQESERTFVCQWCGEDFISNRQKKYCCEECRIRSYGKTRFKKKKGFVPALSLSQVAILSRQAGLSYGRYVQLHSL